MSTHLAQLYKKHLEQLGAATTGRVHTSRLKEKLLSVFPDFGAYYQGINTMFSFSNDVSNALKMPIIMIVIIML